MTPYEIAVLRSVDFDTLWALNTIVNIVFFVDMVSGNKLIEFKVSSMNLLSLAIHGADPQLLQGLQRILEREWG